MKDLLDFLDSSPSPYHAVKNSVDLLEASGFQELDFSKKWDLKPGGSYYTRLYATTLFAFKVASQLEACPTLRMALAHTDYPCFRLKPHPDIWEKGYLKLNTSVYGGMIRSSWMDRPLSLAGRVALRSDDILKPAMRLVDFKRPVLTIPNLAIHMNPDINKGIELNPQTELSPILALVSELEKNDYFLKLLARELDVAPEDILDFDFYVYNWEKSCLLGAENEFLSAPRLDNLTSVFACISSIISSENKDTIRLISLYDNEEIGSRTKQGGDSTATMLLLEKLYTALGYSKIEYHDALFQSFFLSADVAHGLHPNYVGKCDPTHQPRLGDGVVLKINYSQQYATDVEALAAIKQLCSKKNIPYQEFVNRSDMPCGSTLGSIVSSWLPVRTVDLGVPLLAMHSCRELMGCDDQDALHRLITSFFDV